MQMKTKVLGVGYCLPDKILSNHDLEKMVDTDNEWIIERTGIRERRIVEPGGKNSDLSVEAARRALQDAKIDPLQLDLIILATASPDMPFPSTACIVQALLGAKNAAAFDLAAGCTGFVYALTVAEKFLLSPEVNNILVIGCDVVSSVIDYTDRNTCILFGDGAGAMVLGKSEGECGILSTSIGADGTGAGLLYMPAGGSALPATHETVEKRLHYLRMNGNEIFKFATKIVAQTTAELLSKAGLTYDDIDLFVPHQANLRIIQSAMRRMKLPPEKVAINLDLCGNISAGSIPVALAQHNEKHPIKNGANILMVAFGTGLTYGGAILRWGRD
ncbi:MAG: 3-oxoacyl-ACP synthase [Firmicutes bacterium HGW-Firmicutes-15]|nr:MAG: 3-oxoacyl-ACP synthase [Firmicutes bacterium HGW-Firmicutes-15]